MWRASITTFHRFSSAASCRRPAAVISYIRARRLFAVMRRSHFERRLGAQHLCPTFDDALARAREIHAQRFSGAWPNVAAPIPLPVDTRPESG